MNSMKRICVFTGSYLGARPEYLSAAQALGRELAARGLELVYGGAHIGLMGALADTVLAEKGRVVGVIPDTLVDREVAHHGLSELHVVDSMHARKAKMAALADGVIALPGGIGTLEELFEALTWRALHIHAKPCGLLNINHYYDLLLQFLQHSVNEKFLKAEYHAMLVVGERPAEVLDAFEQYERDSEHKMKA